MINKDSQSKIALNNNENSLFYEEGFLLKFFTENFIGYFINFSICDFCFYAECNLEEFNTILLNFSSPQKNKNSNKIDINFLIESYFEPLHIENYMKCEKCKKKGIQKIIKFIYKLPKNIFFGFSNYQSEISNQERININSFEQLIYISLKEFCFNSLITGNEKMFENCINNSIIYF